MLDGLLLYECDANLNRCLRKNLVKNEKETRRLKFRYSGYGIIHKYSSLAHSTLSLKLTNDVVRGGENVAEFTGSYGDICHTILAGVFQILANDSGMRAKICR